MPEKHCGMWIKNTHWNHMQADVDLKTSCDPGQMNEHLHISMAAISASKTHVHPNEVITGRSLAS